MKATLKLAVPGALCSLLFAHSCFAQEIEAVFSGIDVYGTDRFDGQTVPNVNGFPSASFALRRPAMVDPVETLKAEDVDCGCSLPAAPR